MYYRAKATHFMTAGKWIRISKAKWEAFSPADKTKYETKPEGKSPKQVATNQLRQLRFHLAAAQGQIAKVKEIFEALDVSIKDQFVKGRTLSGKFSDNGRPLTFVDYGGTGACATLSRDFLLQFADSIEQLKKDSSDKLS